MRSRIILFCFITAIAVSCVKERPELIQTVCGDQIFYATIEEPNDSETRVFINEQHRVVWDSLDVISVFSRNNVNIWYRYSGGTGTNTGSFTKYYTPSSQESPIDLNYIYATYPNAPYRITTEGEVPVLLKSNQQYQEGKYAKGANAMVSVGTTNDLCFKNVCGYLKLRLYGDNVTVSQIKFEGNNGEILAGTAIVSLTPETDPVLSFDLSKTHQDYIYLTGDVKLGSTPETATEFWLVLPPTTFEKGFKITVGESGTEAIFVKSASTSFTIERNKVKKMAPLKVIPSYSYPIPESVDLGLSVKWASFDLGASEPAGVGYSFAWGEVDPRVTSSYRWGTLLKDKRDSVSMLTKYCTISEYGNGGYLDMKTRLDPEDDPATTHLGDSWRTPTDAEWRELITKCAISEDDRGNYVFTSTIPGYEDRQITLGAEVFAWDYRGYWSSSLCETHPTLAYAFAYDYDYTNAISLYLSDRYLGVSYNGSAIRAVQGEGVKTPVSGVSLDESSLTLSVGQDARIQATVTPAWANDNTLIWSVDNPSVASIEDDGKGITLDGYQVSIKACGFGQTTVTATSRDGGFTATCKVIVTNAGASGYNWDEIPSDLVTVHNPTKGGLEDVMLEMANYESIHSLKITGVMNDVDFLFVYRDMPNLRYLDISEISNTTLPNKVFYNSTNVTHLILPKPLTEIGEWAFFQSKLEAIKIMKNVTSIGMGAFSGCSALKDVTFEAQSKLKTICSGKNKELDNMDIISGVFYGCSSLPSIVFPASLEFIGSRAFQGCSSLTTILFEEGSNLKTIEGGFYEISRRSLGAFYGCAKLDQILFPASLETIQVTAFKDCIGLKRVAFEEGSKLKSIEGMTFSSTPSDLGAFSNTGLIAIDIPSSTESIGINAFSHCTSLSSVVFERAGHLKEIVSAARVEDGTFYGCDALSSIENIPSSVHKIGQYGLSSLPSLKTVSFESNSTCDTIANSAFSNCSNLQEIVIPASVQMIGQEAFIDCSSMPRLSFEKGSALKSIKARAFVRCRSIPSIVFPASLEVIGSEAFTACTILSSITFESGSNLQTIGKSAFRNLHNLNNVVLPPSLKRIGAGAFYYCESLNSIDFGPDSQLKSIEGEKDNGAFSRSGLKTVTIPASTETIGVHAFSQCASLVSVEFEQGGHLSSLDGAFETKGVFSSCNALKSIIGIPASVSAIKEYALFDLPALESVSFESGSTCEIIEKLAFSRCKKLCSIQIPASVKMISEEAFRSCTSLADISFEESSMLNSIGESCFMYCAFKTIRIPAGVTVIPDQAFAFCQQLQKVSFAENSLLTAINNKSWSAFRGCTALRTVDATYCTQLSTIADGVFYGLSTLKLFYSGAQEPPTVGGTTFEGIDPYSVLKVPDESVAAYKSKSGWKSHFASITGFSE